MRTSKELKDIRRDVRVKKEWRSLIYKKGLWRGKEGNGKGIREGKE